MAELLDLYDINMNLTGKTIERGQPFEDEYYVLITHLCMINDKKEILCQRRALEKAGHPGYWDFTAAGFALSQETGGMAISRELKEELGISINITEENLFFTLRADGSFHSYYFILKDITDNPFVLQKEEVMDVHYYSIEQIKELIQNNQFIPYGFMDLIEQCVDSFNQQKKETMGN